MVSNVVHQFLGALLLGLTLADALFFRSGAGQALRPEELMKRWRRTLGLLQMFLFIVVIGLGLAQWWPLKDAYKPGVIHTKLTLAFVFLVLAKIRMLKERRSGTIAPHLTRGMLGALVALFLLGASIR